MEKQAEKQATKWDGFHTGAPQLIARIKGGQSVVYCPFCRRNHYHSLGAGHRVAHCTNRSRLNPYVASGYNLVYDPGAERDPVAVVRQYFPTLREYLRDRSPSLAALLERGARVYEVLVWVGVYRRTLVLRTLYPFHKEALEVPGNKQLIVSILEKHFVGRWDVEILLWGDEDGEVGRNDSLAGRR